MMDFLLSCARAALPALRLAGLLILSTGIALWLAARARVRRREAKLRSLVDEAICGKGALGRITMFAMNAADAERVKCEVRSPAETPRYMMDVIARAKDRRIIGAPIRIPLGPEQPRSWVRRTVPALARKPLEAPEPAERGSLIALVEAWSTAPYEQGDCTVAVVVCPVSARRISWPGSRTAALLARAVFGVAAGGMLTWLLILALQGPQPAQQGARANTATTHPAQPDMAAADMAAPRDLAAHDLAPRDLAPRDLAAKGKHEVGRTGGHANAR